MKNKENINALIKNVGLYNLLRNSGIKSISPEVFSTVNSDLNAFFQLLAVKLKERLEIKGKKTLKAEDFQEIFKEFFPFNFAQYLKKGELKGYYGI